jgi:hypothetical protein
MEETGRRGEDSSCDQAPLCADRLDGRSVPAIRKADLPQEWDRMHKQPEPAYFTVKFTVYVATLWLIWSSTVSLSV